MMFENQMRTAEKKRSFSGLFMMFAVLMLSILVVFILPDSPAFSDKNVTSIAFVTLICGVIAVCEGLLSNRFHSHISSFIFGVPVAFFLRQSEVSEELAAGAERILWCAFFLGVGIIAIPYAKKLMRSSDAI